MQSAVRLAWVNEPFLQGSLKACVHNLHSTTEDPHILCWVYIQHAQERTAADDNQRLFQPLKSLVLPKRTCFVLTAKGQAAISESLGKRAEKVAASKEGPHALSGFPVEVPRWESSSRQLFWQDDVIKVFRRPAPNQELVLAALEEEGWPPQIDDPLPTTKYIDSKARLHDTIKALNRRHLQRIIRFGGDGKGQAVQWFWVQE